MTRRLTLVLPYYNEAGYIAATLESLAMQDCHDFRVIAVDNGSTDRGPAIARETAARFPWLDVEFLHEAAPGKIHALRSGTRAATTELVGTLDADTIYPPGYVARILAAFERRPNAACVLAFAAEGRPLPPRSLILQSRILRGKCHSGGCGQTFRRDVLVAAGGFDPDRWGWVLEDHEIVHRVSRHGPLVYDARHLCFPSDRRTDRTGCSWTLAERMAYKLLPGAAMDWFFYRFLASRFTARGLANAKLREQAWGECGAASTQAG